MGLTDTEIRERIARRLKCSVGNCDCGACVGGNPDIPGDIDKVLWPDGGGAPYRDPLHSHDTLHAAEKTLSDDEWYFYMLAVDEALASKAPDRSWDDGGETLMFYQYRRPSADVLVMALAEVLGGRS